MTGETLCALCWRPIVDETGATIVIGLEDPDQGEPDAEERQAHPECVVLWGAGFGEWCDLFVHGDPETWDEDLAEYAAMEDDLTAGERTALKLYQAWQSAEATRL